MDEIGDNLMVWPKPGRTARCHRCGGTVLGAGNWGINVPLCGCPAPELVRHPGRRARVGATVGLACLALLSAAVLAGDVRHAPGAACWQLGAARACVWIPR
jgi:hypothetical protein